MGEQVGRESAHKWRFFRAGGFDQVRLETADDLLHIGELDQKLWSVLACPTSGLEFDSRTLALIDQDGDGQIRSPEIVAAVAWACATLKDPAVLFRGDDSLSLDEINDSNPQGALLLATARRILGYLGKSEADAISIEDASDHKRLFSSDHFNGDGIVPAGLTDDEALRRIIESVIECCGSEVDRSGEPGVTRTLVDAFFEQAAACVEWGQKAESAASDIRPLGDKTAAAAELFDSVRTKIDDYFTRCRLARFDEGALVALNPAAALYEVLGEKSISSSDDAIAALPLARIITADMLPLGDGVNPAWVARIERLRTDVIVPLLGERESISAADWQDLSSKFAAYRAWVAERPAGRVALLDRVWLEDILANDYHAALCELIERDEEPDAAAETVEAVERLVRFNRDLVTLLRNFISLADFYSARKKAIFQAGTLYLDQRSCELCLRVGDMERHGAFANFSGAYLAYCKCVRKDCEPITIVAAMTGGDADELMAVGRNGVFYDRQGRDWNASVVKIVEHPISVRQAFWSPYKRIGRMISDLIQKFAASKDKAIEERSAARIAESAEKVETGSSAAAAQAFDIAKFAGIFAAIGLALGAIGTALAAIVAGLLALPAWQLPVVAAGVILLISGPSMLLAWLTLRRRNLGPLLDANGWAVNTHARINIPFGGSLTGVAALPPGSSRSLEDPFAEKQTPWKAWFLFLMLVTIIAVLWQQGALSGLFM